MQFRPDTRAATPANSVAADLHQPAVALAGHPFRVKLLTVSRLQGMPAGVDGLLTPGLINAFNARLYGLVAERYRLSEFLQSACNRSPISCAQC